MKYLIQIDNQTYEVEIVDLNARPIVAIVDGERIEVQPQNGQSLSSSKPPSPAPASQATKTQTPPTSNAPTGVAPRAGITVRAPIPGVIVAMLVRAGDEVVLGQELCTIEAMKMRNNIRAARAGRIAEIFVNPGQTVNHNDPLIRFEEQA